MTLYNDISYCWKQIEANTRGCTASTAALINDITLAIRNIEYNTRGIS